MTTPQKPEIMRICEKCDGVYDYSEKECVRNNGQHGCFGVVNPFISISSLTEFLESKKPSYSRNPQSDYFIIFSEILTYLQTATNEGEK